MCQTLLSNLSKPDISEVKMTGKTVQVHKLLCGEEGPTGPTATRHGLGVSLAKGGLSLSVPSEHTTIMTNIKGNKTSHRRLLKSSLMDMDASSSIISLKIVHEGGYTLYEDTERMTLTDASGIEMRILGIAWLRINTHANPQVKAQITCIVTDSINNYEVLIGSVDQKKLLLLHQYYPH